MHENPLGPSDNQVVSLRRRNALHSKTSVLPPEILSLIFQYACPLVEYIDLYGDTELFRSRGSRYFRILIGSISHAWRQVAWSTPQLWTELSIVAPCSGEKNPQNPASLLELFFINVRNLPIILHIEFGEARVDIPEYDPIAQIFFREQYLRKLGSLSLDNAPDSWLCRLSGPFPRLVNINIYVGDWIESAFAADYPFLLNAPMLRKISLASLSVPMPKTPWSGITVLKLEDILSTDALEFLFWCPNLIEFYFVSDPGRDDHDEQGELPDMFGTLTLPHLQTLSTSFYNASELLLLQLQLPALQSLTWDQYKTFPVGTPPPPGIWTFIQNLSGAPLTTLRILGIRGIDLNFVEHICQQTPRIESISLLTCDQATYLTILRFLISGCNNEGSVGNRPYWAKLKRLEFRGGVANGPVELRDLEAFGDLVADLLVELASADFDSSSCVDLECDICTEIRWTPNTKERLRELDRCGAKVQLLENGKRMGWL